jgi:hypothetical protein
VLDKSAPRYNALDAFCTNADVRERRMKILYVEDNDDNVYMLKHRLSRAGFTVIIATDGVDRCGLPPSDDCIEKAAQIERGWTRPTKLRRRRYL